MNLLRQLIRQLVRSIERIGQASLKDVEEAIESAEKGFAVWSTMTAIERSRILLKAVSLLRQRNDELAALEVMDTGKPLQEANCVDIHTGADVSSIMPVLFLHFRALNRI
jgi:betaine-aldehyde dehydrogenase